MIVRLFRLFLLFLLFAQPAFAGQVYYANMDENTGTTLHPNVGSTNCAFTNSPTWTTGKFLSGIDFDAGTTDYLDCGTSHIVTTDDWLFAAWVKLETSGTARVILISGDNDTVARSGLVFWVSGSDKLTATAYVGTDTSCQATSTASIDETGSVWTHVCAKKSGTSLTTWINGSQDGSATCSSSTMDYTGDNVRFYIAANNDTTVPWLGQLDEVRPFDSAEDCAAIYALVPGLGRHRGGQQ